MNTVIFARGYNITGQVEECRKYAEKQGYTVAGVVVAQGSELPSVIGGLGEDIKLVIVHDMARISRNYFENYAILAELELDYGVKVEDATARRNDIEERLMVNIIKAVRENDIKERIRLKNRIEL